MRFLFMFLAVTALTVGCNQSPSNDTSGNDSESSTTDTTADASKTQFVISKVT